MFGVTESEGHSSDSNSKQKNEGCCNKKTDVDNPFVVDISPEKPNIGGGEEENSRFRSE